MSHSALAAGIRRLRSVAATQRRHDESDEQLLHAFADHHDDNAFAALVRRHGPMVLGVCRRVLWHAQDAEDAFQATFLVLARRAAALRSKAALPSFLHRTAYYLALRAKRAAARRHKHEDRAPARSSCDPSGELLWREVQAILDEEIARLPERYRSVFVLCCLESLSRTETARRLGVKEGTVASRLAEARKRLQQRLSRRGVELTALLAATALTADSASALPATLLHATTRAAVASAVVKPGWPLLGLSKAKLVLLVLTATLLASGVALAPRVLSSGESSGGANASALASFSRGADATPLAQSDSPEIHVRVLDPDGNPRTGAKLLLLDDGGKVTPLGVTTAEGRFRVTIPSEPKYRKVFRYLLAQADGTGIDFLQLDSQKPGKPVELRLVKDNPIRGRIVNTEGKPIAGVRVVAEDLEVYPNNSMDVFLDAYLKLLAGGKGYGTEKQIWSWGGGLGDLFTATTDEAGRFVLSGLGAERTLHLRLSGQGIAVTTLWITNRAGFDPGRYNQAFRDYFIKANGRKDQRWMERCMLHRSDFSVIAEPEKIIRGTVTDADTGKGVAGLGVWVNGYDDDMMLLFQPSGKTDAEGRYEIHGARKARRYLVQSPGDPAAGYMPGQVWADDTTGYQPAPGDFKVKKGVIVTGKVIDRASGEAIPGWAQAAPLEGNGFVEKYGRLDSSVPRRAAEIIGRSTKMDADGTFHFVTIPGPMLLMGGPDHQLLRPLQALRYRPPVADPDHPKYFRAADYGLTYVGPGGARGNVEGNFCKVLDIKPGTTVVQQDILLERARELTVQIQDAEGRPLSGVWMTGVASGPYHRAIAVEKDSCPVYHLEPGRERLLVFVEAKRRLAGSITLKGDEKGPLVVKLGPAGSIKGRLRDANGKPLAGIAVDVRYRASEADDAHETLHEKTAVVSDANGDFTFDGVIPRMKFVLTFRQGSKRWKLDGQPAEATMEVDPGACHDGGTLTLKPAPERMRRP